MAELSIEKGILSYSGKDPAIMGVVKAANEVGTRVIKSPLKATTAEAFTVVAIASGISYWLKFNPKASNFSLVVLGLKTAKGGGEVANL